MKLIIAGATGLVGKELTRQCVRSPEITTLVLLSRKPAELPTGPGIEKVKQVVIEDYEKYPESIRAEFQGASACIWTVAITPSKSRAIDPKEVQRINETCPLAALEAFRSSDVATPFKFIYMSGSGTERDPEKANKSWILPKYLSDYMLSRGQAEVKVLEWVQQHRSKFQICIPKPGLITNSDTLWRSSWGGALQFITPSTVITQEDIATAMIHQAVHGLTKDTLTNEELLEIAKAAHEEAQLQGQ